MGHFCGILEILLGDKKMGGGGRVVSDILRILRKTLLVLFSY